MHLQTEQQTDLLNERLEEQRKKFYMIKSELKSHRERINDKNTIMQNYKNESNYLLKQLESLSIELFDKKTDIKKLDDLKISLAEKKEILEEINRNEIELEKLLFKEESDSILKKVELIPSVSYPSALLKV